MSYGMYCRICNKLIIPSKDCICVECKDALKRNGYVKVVRCKDCKYYSEPTDEKAGGCLIKAGYFPVSENWFCADGELAE